MFCQKNRSMTVQCLVYFLKMKIPLAKSGEWPSVFTRPQFCHLHWKILMWLSYRHMANFYVSYFALRGFLSCVFPLLLSSFRSLPVYKNSCALFSHTLQLFFGCVSCAWVLGVLKFSGRTRPDSLFRDLGLCTSLPESSSTNATPQWAVYEFFSASISKRI